jgi:hypothetical protein
LVLVLRLEPRSVLWLVNLMDSPRATPMADHLENQSVCPREQETVRQKVIQRADGSADLMDSQRANRLEKQKALRRDLLRGVQWVCPKERQKVWPTVTQKAESLVELMD